ncbi:hypothetical protein [Paraburkholderia solisilvae]|uniref:Uncharacterized protein n=1 Tax=Paraburkholderia solisilvae TaxID=624376 RepID=A0A6J5DID4_9BURK|nr:hypothetical protein [Paraburkholderia solisilvae]CAB3752805.1 hypothetical protein LMG29739_01590 [Paraburkholderia solisilvae]
MNYKTEIYEQYMARAVTVDGGEIFLHAFDAQNFVAHCESRNLAILGFDTFRIDKRGILPLLDGIADFSPQEKRPWSEYRSTCNLVAAKIIEQLLEDKEPEETYFSFVLWDETEYGQST